MPGLNGHTVPGPFCGRHREPLRGKRTAIGKGEDEPGSLPTLAGGSKLDPLPVAVLAQRAVVVMWSRATSLTLAEDIGVASSARPVVWRHCRTPCVQNAPLLAMSDVRRGPGRRSVVAGNQRRRTNICSPGPASSVTGYPMIAIMSADWPGCRIWKPRA